MNTKNKNTFNLLKFIIPSTIGVLLFMTPMNIDGKVTIPIAFLANFFVDILGNNLLHLATLLISLSAIGSILTKTIKPKFIINNSYLKHLFDVTPIWLLARILGMIFVVCANFKIGPEMFWSMDTGGFILHDLLPILICVFMFAGFLLPLLLDFGLLEFIGAILTKIMRPIFKLPGRSSIDCITSWLGDGSVGILLTSKQYELGYYTKKEAAIISTNFSAVSITFCLVVLAQVGLDHMFVPFYLTVSVAGILAAIIIPRIPPLSKKSDTLINDKVKENSEAIPEGYNSFSYGLEKAVEKASLVAHPKEFVISGLKNVFDMWIGVLAIVMAMGAIALIISTYTPIFQILGTPFIPILKMLGVPEAVQASQTMVVGFADMFLPSVLAGGIQSEMTRFIIAAVSVTQLVYMSEIGGLLLGSKIPVNFKDLVIIFITRTLVTLPIIVLMANLIF